MDGRLLGGRYRLLEAHAMGGMASVWRAHDERSGEVVAVKRLHPHLIADEAARERFRREAEAMEAIRHPNVVGVRDAIVDDDEPALVMDFIAGRSIAELAADGHRFGEVEALAIASAVTDGLASVHDRGIVHRDIKPANVLVGDDDIVRLSDFGIAVGAMDATALTADDGVVGTLRYLAPERLAGHPATPATDVWGVGTVLYEMLAGVAAFPATTLAARVDSASVPVERPDGLADATWAVLARALASEPADRYADGRAMTTDLHRLPGVPAPLEVDADASAPTEVIELPIEVSRDSDPHAASAAERAAAGAALVAAVPGPGLSDPADIPRDQRSRQRASATARPGKPSRGAIALAGMLGALTLALLVGMATASPSREDPDAAAGAASRSPAATPRPTATVTPTPAPEKADGESKPGKGNGKGKGDDDKDD